LQSLQQQQQQQQQPHDTTACERQEIWELAPKIMGSRFHPTGCEIQTECTENVCYVAAVACSMLKA
jgi:hypothetical protein